MKQMVKIIHSGNAGDLIYSLPAIRKASEIHNNPVHLYLRINVAGQYAGMNHPLGNVQMNETIAEMLTPLLLSTKFIESVEITEQAEQVDYNFDLFRKIHNYTGHISQWYFHVYPELTCDLADPIAFDLAPIGNNEIILNRTARYHNPTFDYSILRRYKDRISFVGLPDEYRIISAKLPDISHIEVKDFAELCGIIKGCELFVGNQSMAYAIAEVMKHPRVVEICPTAHNVIPTGDNGYGAWTIMNLTQILKSKYE
jgi:ADP-heptose:LPS heptosyltransferase